MLLLFICTADTKTYAAHTDSTIIHGVVFDAHDQPAIYALVFVEAGTTAFDSCRTDTAGKFTFKIPKNLFDSCSIALTALYPAHKNLIIYNLKPTEKELKLWLDISDDVRHMIENLKYVPPIININHPGGNRHISAKQISCMP
ncbi:hypothetical protein ACTHGU_21380 [Chitinophagaceae bacterium MMS25-I14]